MKPRLLILLIFGMGLVSLSGAHYRAPQSSAADHLQLFQQNGELIRALVQGGLQLATEEDPLRRADYCSSIAEQLAAELHGAASRGDKVRCAELGGHLHALLEHALVPNLHIARRQIPTGSLLEKHLQEVSHRVSDIVAPLEIQLAQTVNRNTEIERTLKVLLDDRLEIEKTVEFLHKD